MATTNPSGLIHTYRSLAERTDRELTAYSAGEWCELANECQELAEALREVAREHEAAGTAFAAQWAGRAVEMNATSGACRMRGLLRLRHDRGVPDAGGRRVIHDDTEAA